MFEALLALIERLGREQPVVLVLEDLHWADPSTRDFLTFLVRSARTEPLCLVVTYRSDELHRRHPLRPLLAELERTPGVDRLELERFSREEMLAQISAILGAPAPEELADRLFRRSEGNPLYTEELLAASSDCCPELPDTLRDLLLNRVERLPEVAQEVVRLVSVEHPMRHPLLAALCDLDDASLLQGLRDAVAHQVLVAGPGETYAFRHALVGEAVYGDLLPGERSALHARLAETLDAHHELMGDAPAAAVAGILACHWNAAHDVPRALGSSVAAGLASKRVFAFGEAKRHFERALELWDRVPDAAERAGCDRADLLRHAATAATHSGETARSLALMRMAIAEVDERADPMRAAFLLELLGNYLRWAGETEPSRGAYERAMALVGDGESPQRARLLEHHARGTMLRGRFAEAAAGAERAHAMAERLGDANLQSRSLNTLGLSRAALGDVERGLELLRRSRDLAARIGPPVAHVQAVINLSEVLDLSGRTEEALAEVRACMEVMDAHPERTTYDTFLEAQGISHLIRLGRIGELDAGPAGGHVRRRGRHDPDLPARAARAGRADHGRPAPCPGGARRAAPALARDARPAVDRAAARPERAARAARGTPRRRARRRRAGARGDRRHRGRPAPRPPALDRPDGRGERRGARPRTRRALRPGARRGARGRPRRGRSPPRPVGRGPALRARSPGPSSRACATRSARPTPHPGRGRRPPRASRRSPTRGPPPTRASAPRRHTCRPATGRPRSSRCGRPASAPRRWARRRCWARSTPSPGARGSRSPHRSAPPSRTRAPAGARPSSSA